MKEILDVLKQKLEDDHIRIKYRKDSKAFTRSRKLDFKTTVKLTLSKSKGSLGFEVDNFFNQIEQKAMKVSTSAYVQARDKINPELYKELSEDIPKLFYSSPYSQYQKRYKGYRLLSIDGSLIELPPDKSLKEKYGFTRNQTSEILVKGRLSSVYDVLNKLQLHSVLRPLEHSEQHLLKEEHFPLFETTDLLLLDRAYPGFELLHQLHQKGIHFVMRAKVSFNKEVRAFYKSDLTSCIINFSANKHLKGYQNQSPIPIRMEKIILNTGECEILITSLLDTKAHTKSDLNYLYNLRWQEEEFFKALKSLLKLETFSGLKSDTILQDFYIALFLYNLYALINIDLQKDLEVYNTKGSRKYDYQLNRNLAFGVLKKRVIDLFQSQKDTALIYEELKKLFFSHKIPIRKGRSNIRNVQKYDKRCKPKSFNNQKFNA